MFADFAQNMTWIPDGYHVVRDIFYDDASGADDGVFADRDSWNDGDSGTDSGVFTDVNRFVVLHCSFTKFRVDWVIGGCNRDVRAEHDFVANVDIAVIYNCKHKFMQMYF